jgi:Domain of unknown function (DUF5011)/HYR domain
MSMINAINKTRRWCAVLALVGVMTACSAKRYDQVTSNRQTLATSNGLVQNGLSTNGLWLNGLWLNGLWLNGLWLNGLWLNGLWLNGLWLNGLSGNSQWGTGLWANSTWASGLTGDAAVPGNALRSSPYTRQLLQYIYQCAMPPTTYDTSLDPNNGALKCSSTVPCDFGYTCNSQNTCVVPLTGSVGIGINADGTSWGASGTCDESCQRWVSACVLARTNAYGVHVEISMRAPADAPQAIKDALKVDDTGGERETFSLREGAYYGNIFATTPTTPPPAGGNGQATGAIAATPVYYACAGPGSNIPEITKRFCSSQGDQTVINVPGVCLGTSEQGPVCEGEDTDQTSLTRGAIQDCHTGSNLAGTTYKEVLTVYLKQPIAVCGNEVCEKNEDDSTLPLCTSSGVSGPCYCPSDCHPGTWANNFAPNIANNFVAQTGYAYTDQYFRGEQLGMSAVGGPDNSIAVIGMAQGAVDLGGGSLPTDPGFGILAKFDHNGQYVWGIRFGNTSLSATDGQLQELNAVAVAPNGNITVVGKAQETVADVTYNDIWIRTYSPDRQLVRSTTLREGPASSTSFLQLSRSVGLDSLDDNVVIAGRYQGNVLVPMFPMFSNSDVPLSFVAKISPGTPNNPVVWANIPPATFSPDTSNLEEDVGHHTLSLDAGDDVVTLDQNILTKLDHATGLVVRNPGGGACSMGNIYFAYGVPGVVPWRMAAAVDPSDPDRSIYVTGYALNQPSQTIQGEVISAPPILEKFDKYCERQWTTTPTITCAFGCSLPNGPTPNLHGTMIGFGPTGEVIVGAVGSPFPGGSIDFGAGLFPTYTSENIYLTSYSTAGAFNWAKQFPVILGNSLLSMSISGEGRLVAGGTYSGSMQFDDRLLVTEKPEDPAVVDSFLGSYGTPAADVTPPQIGGGNNDPSGTAFSTVPKPIYVQATGPAGATVFFMPPTAIDNGNAGVSVSCLPRPNTTFPIGTTIVNCTASDPRGNGKDPNNQQSNASFTVTVVDTMGPVFLPVLDVKAAATGANGANVSYPAPSAVDQVDGSEGVKCTPSSGSLFSVGTTKVTCSASDSRGNQSSTTFSVTVTPPAVPVSVACLGTAAAPVLVSTAPGMCGAPVGVGLAGSCSGGTAGLAVCTLDGVATETLGPGVHPVVLVATGLDGSTASCTSYVRVTDGQKPIVTCAKQTVACTGNGGATVTPVATCTDNCSCTASCAPARFPVGVSSGSCTATDPAGNSAGCQPAITVVDAVAPVVTPRSGPTQLQCNVDKWTDPGATALDQCVGDVSSSVRVSGAVDPTHVGTYVETYSASDPSGNLGSATRSVKVVDSVAPATTATAGPNGTPNRLVTIAVTSYTVTPTGGGTPITGSATCWSTVGVAMSLKATDACSLKQLTYSLSGAQSGGATVSGGSASFAVTHAGTTTVSYHATDSAGNAEVSKTLLVHVASLLGFGISCAPSPSLKGLPAHGTVSVKGTVTIADSRTLKQTSQPFSFAFLY